MAHDTIVESISNENDNEQKPIQPSAADCLLSRLAPADYLTEWQAFVGTPKNQTGSSPIVAVVLFKIGSEFLALSTAVVGQITQIKPIHRIPHQKGKIVQGLVNINGQLRLFVSMNNLLEISSEGGSLEGQQKQSMMVLEKESDVWAFKVSEVCGVYHCETSLLHNVPVNVAKSTANYLKGVFRWSNNSVGYLDDELLLFSLRKCLV